MDKQHLSQLDSIIALEHYNPFAAIPSEDIAKVRTIHEEGNYPVSIRLNPFKPSSPSYSDAVAWYEGGYYLSNRPKFTLDPLFHAGAYYVQEASSMFVGHAFQHLKTLCSGPLKVLDLCAAPGGKSTLLASHLTEEDILLSNEVIQSRAGILIENLTKWGHMNTYVSNNDPKDFAKLPNTFDIVLIDAPCTGSGLWRRDVAALDEWSVQHVKLCAERQQRILIDSFDAIKEGGYLIYATCSFSPEEDEHIMNFIEEQFDVAPVSIPLNEEWNIVKGYSEKMNGIGYHFYPWKLRGEGFFLTVYQKKSGKPIENSKPKKKDKKQNQSNNKTKEVIATQWQNFMTVPIVCESINDDIYAFHPEHHSFFHQLKEHLYIKKAGILMGQQMGKDVIPHHELALCVHLKKDIPSIEVSEEEALHYLKKESIKTDEGLKGWLLVSYDGLGLGWGKWMPGRMNNYLPKNWRIRMDLNS